MPGAVNAADLGIALPRGPPGVSGDAHLGSAPLSSWPRARARYNANVTRTAIALVLFAAAAAATPPEVHGFARMAELERRLNEVFAELKAKEDFANKSFEEQLIIKLGERADSWGTVKKLDAETVAERLLAWPAAQMDQAPEDVIRILGLLPPVLKQRFDRIPVPKAERYQASLPLVKALTHDFLPLRRFAIDCLEKIYNTRNFYWPDLAPAERKKRQREWYSYIRRVKN